MQLTIKWAQDTSKKKRLVALLLTLFAAFLIIGSPMIVSAKNRLQDLVAVSEFLIQHENYLQKKRILKILSQSDLKLGDAKKIAQTVVEESKKYDIPASLILAIMKKESNFNIHARSPVNAMGIMQIHPVTWDAYSKKLNLDVSRKKAFDPAFNIMVSAALLSDLRDQYLKKGYEETILWDYILSAYYAGGESLKEGLQKNHRYYVKKVRQYDDEMSSTI
ncbi:MAG: lytic transglycosylase domain-containing protein [Pseudomonadota bacterium]